MKSLSIKIVICVVLCMTLGILSGFSTIQSITNWYQCINKPSWNPPNWLFGPVWTILYLMMGISVALIWHSTDSLKKSAISIFIAQFILNLGWSFIFFNLHQIGFAFFEILLMLLTIFFTIRYFNKINKAAAILLVPYFCWVSFASILNGSIWLLNK